MNAGLENILSILLAQSHQHFHLLISVFLLWQRREEKGIAEEKCSVEGAREYSHRTSDIEERGDEENQLEIYCGEVMVWIEGNERR